MSDNTRTPARPTKRARPMADMSPGKAEERIRSHPTPVHDHKKVMSGAGDAATGFFQDFFSFSVLGMLPAADKASTK